MQYIKFQEHQLTRSKEEGILKFLLFKGMVAIMVL